MNPAASVIDKLGGVSKVARAVGVHRTRVSNWKRQRTHGGTGGRIPQKHIPPLMAYAEEIGVPLTFAEFFPSEERVA